MEQVTVQNLCRVCGTDAPPLTLLLDLGPMTLSDFPREAGQPPAHSAVPLTLMACSRCWLVQLRHTTPFPWMFGGTYWYRSGVNETMRAELESVVADALNRADWPGHGAYVLDIGANDGTLLSFYGTSVGSPCRRIAFEPSPSARDALWQHCDDLYPCAFPLSNGLTKYYNRVKVITCVAVAYDLQDPLAFFFEIARLLAPDGVCLIQFQDLAQMVAKTAFDNIVHEHLEHYSLTSLANLLSHCGLWVTDVETRAINGGSLRAIVHRRGHGATPAGTTRVLAQLRHEERLGVTGPALIETFERFAQRIAAMKIQIRATLDRVRAYGVVDLYAASTKANTLLQLLGVTKDEIRCAWERSPEKYGRFVGQTGIPVVSETAGRYDPPAMLLVGAWQFRDAILLREGEYLAQGGAICFPLPHAEIVLGARR